MGKNIKLIKQKKHSRSYKIKSIKSKKVQLLYVKDIVTNQVIKTPIPVACKLIEELEHMYRATKKEWRYYLKDQKEKPKPVQPKLYWKDKPETKKIGDKEIITRNYLPEQNPKYRKYLKDKKTGQMVDVISFDKEKSRKQRREFKHRSPGKIFDMYTKHQTIVIQPEYTKKVYKLNKVINPIIYRKNKSTGELITKPNKRLNKYLKTLDLVKSKVKTEKFQINQLVFDYDYIPKIFSSKKQPTEIPLLHPNGDPIVEKIYKGKRVITVTIEQPSRTRYKTIVTRNYPSVISNRRHIVKKNIELFKKEQENQKNNQNEEKAKN